MMIYENNPVRAPHPSTGFKGDYCSPECNALCRAEYIYQFTETPGDAP
jgi:hypothetical protein